MEPSREQGAVQGNSFGVVGAGAVGGALARGLGRAGATVRIWSRNAFAAEELVRDVSKQAAAAGTSPLIELAGSMEQVASGAAAVVLAVSEAALPAVAEQLGRELEQSSDMPRESTGSVSSRVALHTSGACGAEVLAPLKSRGWSVGQMHPLAAVPPGGAIPAQTWWGVSGGSKARDVAAWIVKALGGQRLDVQEGQSVRYHLAANLVAGGAVALVDLARGALGEAVDAEAGRKALAALLSSTANNLAQAEPEAALTGPQARGQVQVVGKHLEAARDGEPELLEAYVLLARRMVALARKSGRADASRLAELERLLDRP